MPDHPQLTIEGPEERSSAPEAPVSVPAAPARLFAAPQTIRGQLAIPDAPAPRERSEDLAAPQANAMENCTLESLYRRLARLRQARRPSDANISKRVDVLLAIERRTGVWHGY